MEGNGSSVGNACGTREARDKCLLTEMMSIQFPRLFPSPFFLRNAWCICNQRSESHRDPGTLSCTESVWLVWSHLQREMNERVGTVKTAHISVTAIGGTLGCVLVPRTEQVIQNTFRFAISLAVTPHFGQISVLVSKTCYWYQLLDVLTTRMRL